jgi:hypothetical protein
VPIWWIEVIKVMRSKLEGESDTSVGGSGVALEVEGQAVGPGGSEPGDVVGVLELHGVAGSERTGEGDGL